MIFRLFRFASLAGGLALCASRTASAATATTTYDLAATDVLRTLVVNTNATVNADLKAWAVENAASEAANAGVGVVPAESVSGYRLTSFRVGRGLTRIRAEYAIGDRLSAPADLGEIDWLATYNASVPQNAKNNVLFFTGSGDLSDAAIYFAAGANPVVITWVEKNGARTTRTYIVSDTATTRPYRLYRSDAPYNNGPVSLAGQYVRVVGDDSLFTLSYGTTVSVGSDGHVTTNEHAVTRGVYLTSANQLYAVGDVQGQFLLVYYDSADFARIRKVEVVEACTPSVKVVSALVGEELKPTADGYASSGLYPSVVSSSRRTYDGRGDFIYVHEGSSSFAPHRNAAFAIRPTMDEDDAEDHTWDATINWYAPDEFGVRWPFEQVQYSIRWGEGAKLLISGEKDTPGQTPIFPDDWSVTACTYQSPDGHRPDASTWRRAGRSLFRIDGRNDDGLPDVAFIQVDAVLATNVAPVTRTVAVGVPVEPTDPSAVCVTNGAGRTYLGYIHKPWSATCYDPDDYAAPSADVIAGTTAVTEPTTETTSATQSLRSDIFFVNVPEPSFAKKTLEVWWNVAVGAGSLVGTAYFPSLRETVTPVFPNEDETEQIVLASMKGSAGISVLRRAVTNEADEVAYESYWHTNEALVADSLPQVYASAASAKDGTSVGWNPNVAHAWCEAGDGDYVCWALRCDMVQHSQLARPLVYVKTTVTGADGLAQRRVRTYYVVPTNAAYPRFGAHMLAGQQLPGPHPLDLANDPWLPEIWWDDAATPSAVVAYRDRKGAVWARRDGILDIHMYYASRAEFAYACVPAKGSPARLWNVTVPAGTPVPWNCTLESDKVAMTVEPGAWRWEADWPTNAPSMRVGRTLTTAADGLAEVWNASSAAVLWPEPDGMNGSSDSAKNDVVQLVDPTQRRAVSLAIGPARENLMSALGFSTDPDGNCQYRDGVWYFRDVPATLSRRIYYDPNADISECLCLIGRLDEKTGGISVLHMNVLNDAERAAVKALVADGNPYKALWDGQVDRLAVSPVMPTAHRYATKTAPCGRAYTEFVSTYAPVDHYALASLGGGGKAGAENWVVWIENDADPKAGLGVKEGDAVSMHVMRVEPKFHLGESVTRTDENNLLSQLLDVLYTEPFAGRPEDYVFQWQQAEPQADGTRPGETDWRDAGRTGIGLTRFTLGTQGTLADLVNTYYRVRYRALEGTSAYVTMGSGWSDWTEPCLAEGWIQRVINSITPFTQRVTDLYENPPETTVSMLAQVGGPYRGDVALNMDNLTEVGLLETYVTLLNKAESMSIAMGADASIDKTAVNKQLMQLVERLDDFYALLGNEAYSDAVNPTIACGSASDCGQISSGLFAFDNQVPTLLDEELSLLRGRGVIEDETSGSDVTAYRSAPCYNRLLWNFTRGITAGEVAYALNYNITAGTGETDIQAESAAALYPQGHGDAWGHYLDALKLWYRLLRNPSFSWSVSMGEMNVDDHAINVDYFEESKMAAAAASLGRAAERIVDLTARKVWRDRASGVTAAEAGYEDKVPSRAFGYGEWGSRGGVATFVNWMVVNSLLPAAETNEAAYTDKGLLAVNRSTVSELGDLATRYALVQKRVDRLNDNLNPLGLADDAVPFGLTTDAADGSASHFEQTLETAETALKNADALLKKAGESTAQLRALGTAAQTAADEAAESEESYRQRLVAYYGYPYAGDIGVGKTYAQDYDGPDLYHWMYMDTDLVEAADSGPVTVTVKEGVSFFDTNGTETVVSFDVSRAGLVVKPGSVTGNRRAWGSLQYAYADYLSAVSAYNTAYDNYNAMQADLVKLREHYESIVSNMVSAAKTNLTSYSKSWKHAALQAEFNNKALLAQTEALVRLNRQVAAIRSDGKYNITSTGETPTEADYDESGTAGGGNINGGTNAVAAAAGPRTVSGVTATDNDLTSAEQLWDTYITGSGGLRDTLNELDGSLKKTVKYLGEASLALDMIIDITDEILEMLFTMSDFYERSNDRAAAVVEAADAITVSAERVLTLKAEAEALLDEREATRQRQARAAASNRYADMAHRLWRDEALGTYADAFDLAQRYTWLAAKAYDYETGGSITAGSGTSDFLDNIVGSRMPNELQSDILARLKENWVVQKSSLGIDNPQSEMTWISLRTEAFRILPGEDGLNTWRNKLDTFRVSNLRSCAASARLCALPSEALDEPALVIPLETTITTGKNFFGRDLVEGDHAFSSTRFATKIAAVGVALSGYNVSRDGGAAGSFAENPYVYLVPAGQDRMYAPGTGEVISFNVADQLLEVPNLLGSKALAQSWDALYTDLSGQSEGGVRVRRYPAFRANAAVESSMLIGRSVWNTQWVLVIPASSLRKDGATALEELIWGNSATLGITDIRIGLSTYSHWGK